LRICLENQLELDLRQLVQDAIQLQPVGSSPEGTHEVWTYLLERLRSSYLENESAGISTEMFDAVVASNPRSPLDIHARLMALRDFLRLPDAAALASANKRIANILRKTTAAGHTVLEERLVDAAEQQLFSELLSMEQEVTPLFLARDYATAFGRLAGLRQAVDGFFDKVMVMAEDAALRNNRLALLQRVRGLFLQVADLSRLPG
jgi:glycyl-tRNA synthetase beta chain